MSTVFTKPVVINAPEKDVIFNGCDFTKEALISIQSAKSVTFKNCRFYGLTSTAAKAYLINLNKEAEVKLVIEKCFFGTNEKALYNLLELTGYLMDGSRISSNYFAKDCCSHIQVAIYNVKDDATVFVTNNVMSSYRIGLMGSPKCTINIENIDYQVVYEDEWTSLGLIQPYGGKTVSFNDMVLNIKNIKPSNPVEKTIYIYASGKDTKFNWQTNYPKVYIDGVLQEELINLGDPIEGTKPGEEPAPVEDPTVETPEASVSEEPVVETVTE